MHVVGFMLTAFNTRSLIMTGTNTH